MKTTSPTVRNPPCHESHTASTRHPRTFQSSGQAKMADMARTTSRPPEDLAEKIIDIDVSQEMRGSFLEYAYSVIYPRALPDALDGMQPAHRRIRHPV